MNRSMRRAVAAAGAAVAVAGAAACGAGGDGGTTTAFESMKAAASKAAAAPVPPSAVPSVAASVAPSATVVEDPTAGLVGAGCADYAASVPEGAGSIAGMAKLPLATAASSSPLLSTLASAVSGKLNPRVNLVQTLDTGELTVFAPTDDAFAEITPETRAAAVADPASLTKVLTYHVLRGRIGPDRIAGKHRTLEGGTVTVTGSGDDLKVNGASVLCGGVETSNATVYLIDHVLLPR